MRDDVTIPSCYQYFKIANLSVLQCAIFKGSAILTPEFWDEKPAKVRKNL